MKSFLKQTVASLLGTLLAIAVVVGVSTTALVLLLVLLSVDTDPVVRNKTALVLDLSDPIRDTSPPISLSQALLDRDESVQPLRRVGTAIEAAADDDRITALFLDGRQESNVSGYGNLQELATALNKFKQAKKPIIAYGVNWNEPGYYLASIADQLYLNPMGGIELNGFAAQPVFYAGTFDKYGIGVQTVRVGNYKGAIEPFTRQSLSPANREQQQTLLNQLWQSYRKTIADNRDLSPDAIQAIADEQGLVFADAAVTAKLVDGMRYWDEVLNAFKAAGTFMALPSDINNSTEPIKPFRQISATDYYQASQAESEVNETAPTIAVLYLNGTIVNGKGTLETVGSNRYAAILRQLQADDTIKAVVLRINSPGGSASAADIIWREVDRLQEKKPVIVSMGNVAASGGYWIATAGETIFAQPNTITGSIGVFSVLFNIEDLGNRLGLSWDEVQTAELATLGSGVTPKSDLELAVFQRAVNQVYETFLAKVSNSRDLSRAEVDAVAQGRVWQGAAAQEVGLVDQLGGLQTAISQAAETADLGDTWQVKDYPAHKTLETLLIESLNNSFHAAWGGSQQFPGSLEKAWQQLGKEWQQVAELTDPHGIYARLPFWVVFE